MKYHVNPLGDVHPCTAERQCRFGLAASDHYETREAAREAYDKEMNHVGVLSGLKRSTFSDKARAERGEGGTVGHQLASKFGQDALDVRTAEQTDTREVGVGKMAQDSGEPVLGLTYGGDFKAEEEWGQSELVKMFEKGKDQVGCVDFVDLPEGRALVILNRETSYGRLSPESITRSVEDAAERFRSGERNVGQFQNGKALVILTDDPIKQAMAEKVYDAAQANSLRVGSSGNPFGSATMFYDERDLSVATKRGVAKRKAWAQAELAKLDSVRAKFKAKGQNIYAMSNPKLGFTSLVDGRETDPNETYYWLNSGRVSDLGNKQAFGWYNREELETFADGDWSLAKRDDGL